MGRLFNNPLVKSQRVILWGSGKSIFRPKRDCKSGLTFVATDGLSPGGTINPVFGIVLFQIKAIAYLRFAIVSNLGSVSTLSLVVTVSKPSF
jgi:hypothetical protein